MWKNSCFSGMSLGFTNGNYVVWFLSRNLEWCFCQDLSHDTIQMNSLRLRLFTSDVLTNLSAWPQHLIRSILLNDNSSKMEFIDDGHEYKKYSQNERDGIRGLWSCRRPGMNNIICFAAKFSFISIRVHSESRLQFDAHVKLHSNDIKMFRRSVWCNSSLSNVLLNEI